MKEVTFHDVAFVIVNRETARQVLNPVEGTPPWTHVVSIGDPTSARAVRPHQWGDRLLRLTFCDDFPKDSDVAQIATFGQSLPPGARVLFHCEMGWSRSPAAAIILLESRFPTADRREVEDAVHRARPGCGPNLGMLRLWYQHKQACGPRQLPLN